MVSESKNRHMVEPGNGCVLARHGSPIVRLKTFTGEQVQKLLCQSMHDYLLIQLSLQAGNSL